MVALHGVRLPAEAQIRWASWHIWPFSACRGPGPHVPFAPGPMPA
jgi:hypothetical protein